MLAGFEHVLDGDDVGVLNLRGNKHNVREDRKKAKTKAEQKGTSSRDLCMLMKKYGSMGFEKRCGRAFAFASA